MNLLTSLSYRQCDAQFKMWNQDNSGDKILQLMGQKIQTWIVSLPQLLLSKMKSTDFKCYLHDVEECCKVTKYTPQISYQLLLYFLVLKLI